MSTSSENELYLSGLNVQLHLPPFKIFVAFLIVVGFNVVVDVVTNSFETSVQGTSYQLLVQRLYRMIMTTGLSVWLYNVVQPINLPYSQEWEYAYLFADQCIFIMALFYGIQGMFIMAFTVNDIKSWNRAERIIGHDLLLDVERTETSTPYLWKWRIFPWLTARQQVEFRIFRNVFALAYAVGGKSQLFDFSRYLKIEHEQNLLEIIDLDGYKWFLVVAVAGIATFKDYVIEQSCLQDFECQKYYGLVVFCIGGYTLLFLSLFITICNRMSELKLLRMFGVYDSSDYSIYIMVEEDILATLSSKLLNTKSVLKAISELKHDKALKKHRRTNNILEGTSVNSTTTTRVKSAAKRFSLRVLSNMSRMTVASTRYRHPTVHPTMTTTSATSTTDDIHAEKATPVKQPLNSTVILSSKEEEQTNDAAKDIDDVQPFTEDSNSTEFKEDIGKLNEQVHDEKLTKPPFHMNNAVKKPINPPMSKVGSILMNHSDRSTRNLLMARQSFSFQDESEANHLTNLPTNNAASILSNHSETSTRHQLLTRRSFSDEVKDTANMFAVTARKLMDRALSKPVEADEQPMGTVEDVNIDQEAFSILKKRLKNGVKDAEDRTINFKDIFLLHNYKIIPALTTLLVTATSIYIGYWISTFSFITFSFKSELVAFGWAFLSISPIALIFVSLSVSMRSSTILKSLADLSADNIVTVIENTSRVAKNLNRLRMLLLSRLKRYKGQGNEISGVTDLFFEINASATGMLTFQEFVHMLHTLQMFLETPISHQMFSTLDLKLRGVVSLEEFERFLFPEKSAADDLKNKKFFDNANSKVISSKNKWPACNRMKNLLTSVIDGLSLDDSVSITGATKQ